MEATTLSEITGIRTTSGRMLGTNYPALRSSRIKSSNGRALSGSWTHVRRAMANDKVTIGRSRPLTLRCVFVDMFTLLLDNKSILIGQRSS